MARRAALLKFEPEVEVDPDHQITVEDCPPRADGSPQCRWACSCGERGIPVGAPCFAAREWAEVAGWYHVGTTRASE